MKLDHDAGLYSAKAFQIVVTSVCSCNVLSLLTSTFVGSLITMDGRNCSLLDKMDGRKLNNDLIASYDFIH